jgi:DNA-binding NarL/FixJ family response regulator
VIASWLALALAHSGFSRVSTADPDELAADGPLPCGGLGRRDIVLVGPLQGDGRSTLELIRRLADLGCRVLVVVSDQGLPLAGACLGRGAEAVLDKAMSFDRLVGFVRRLSAGGSAMTDEERTALVEVIEGHEAAARSLRQPFEALTWREADVLAAVVAGAAAKQIAYGKGISVSTVRGHIQHVLATLDASTQRQAVDMARLAGWPGADGRRSQH